LNPLTSMLTASLLWSCLRPRQRSSDDSPESRARGVVVANLVLMRRSYVPPQQPVNTGFLVLPSVRHMNSAAELASLMRMRGCSRSAEVSASTGSAARREMKACAARKSRAQTLT